MNTNNDKIKKLTQKIMNHKFQNLILAIMIFAGFFGLAGGAEAPTINIVNGLGEPSCEAADVRAAIGSTKIINGLNMGRRDDLTGGGLKRSGG